MLRGLFHSGADEELSLTEGDTLLQMLKQHFEPGQHIQLRTRKGAPIKLGKGSFGVVGSF